MSSLFADTHNMVALLEKSDAAEGFEQIIDFLNGSYIYYALIVNPHIYVACIKQFWNTASVKCSDDVTRFIQLIIQNQIGDLSTHTTSYISPALTQKVFANMRRVRKGFSGVETPLFEGMLAARTIAEEGLVEEQVQADDAVAAAVQESVAEDIANEAIPSTPTLLILPSPPSHDIPSPSQKLEIIKLKARVKRLERANKVKSSKLRRLKKVGTSQRIKSFDDMEVVFNQGRMIDDLDKDEGIELTEIYHLDLDHPSKVLSMEEDDSEVQEVVMVVTTVKLITEVVTAATSQVSAASATIFAAKPKYARKLHEEINKDHEEINKDIDWDAAIDDVKQKSKENPQYIKRYQVMKKRPQTESEARKNMMIYLKNTAGYKLDFFKGMSYDEICPIFQARFDANMRFLFKSREEMEEEDQEVLKSINETPIQKAAKRRKLNEEAQEFKDLKKHLEVVNDEDDDVFIEATPLARKVPVVDYQIVLINNKPRFKIIKADETHQ
nr:hypothetical protein [Tanacetum cinerariifolium]